MITKSDLMKLVTADPRPGVSIFLPTHVHGSATRQGPVVLKNLLAEAHHCLLAADVDATTADSILAPARDLIDDFRFWQHRGHGLALFLSEESHRHLTAPTPLAESVGVGPAFRIRPLLPMLTAEGEFRVIAVTEGRIRMFDASRYAMAESDDSAVPDNLTDLTSDPDYENLVQAGPAGRPHTATVDTSHAQAYGASSTDWRNDQLVLSVRRLAAAVDQHLAGRRSPVVLVANARIAGHFQKFTRLGPELIGVVDANPEALDDEALHEAAYAVARPHFEKERQDAVERFATLHGSQDPRAAVVEEQVIAAARAGRVETLLLAEQETAPHHGEPVSGADALDEAAVQTLRQGGEVHVLDRAALPSEAGAILRY